VNERITTPDPVAQVQGESLGLSPGTRFGRYDIVSLLGAGGMGVIYRARDPRLGRAWPSRYFPASFRPANRNWRVLSGKRVRLRSSTTRTSWPSSNSGRSILLTTLRWSVSRASSCVTSWSVFHYSEEWGRVSTLGRPRKPWPNLRERRRVEHPEVFRS